VNGRRDTGPAADGGGPGGGRAGVFLDRGSMGDDELDFSSFSRALPRWDYYRATPPEQVAVRIATAHVVVTNKVVLDAAALAAAQQLRLVCVTATGTNNIDVEAARRLGITVCNVPGYATAAVAQLVFAMLLNLYTRLPDYQRAVLDGRWAASEQFCLLDYPIRELAGKVMGIVGYGELGRAVARLAAAFGMEVLIAQRAGGDGPADRVPLPALLPRVDVLTLHCPLTPETRGMIGDRELSLMKPAAVLINTARGGLVDEAALARALRRGVIAGAGVDVLTREPPAAGNPLLAPDIPNLIVTPHIAWASREARQRLVEEVARNIRAFLRGRPRNRVT
jgi:glycerate dehydrogenase